MPSAQTPDLVIRGAAYFDREVDLLIAKSKILDMLDHDESRAYQGAKTVEAHGLTLLPSLIDAHTHFREPGQEYKEDIASGLATAAAGGFGAALCMANTSPVNDDGAITAFMLDQARKAHPKGPRLHPVGALTKGLKGEELAPLAELAAAGCVAFSNDGLPVASSELFRRAMEYAADLGIRVIDHCEEPTMRPGAGMNEGALSGRLGLPAQPRCAESMQVARDILLAGYLDIPIHLAHLSTRESVELVAWAKARSFPVSAETCPHYLVFTEDAVEGYATAAKVNPPLRTPDDQLALLQGLSDGTIDILATDHAPHAPHEKETPFSEAPCGISGLDTALALTHGLVAEGKLGLDVLIRAWSHAPGEIFSLPVNRFQPGDPADFLLFDPEASWVVSRETMRSKSTNTPCLGKTLTGRVRDHFLNGKSIL